MNFNNIFYELTLDIVFIEYSGFSSEYEEMFSWNVWQAIDTEYKCAEQLGARRSLMICLKVLETGCLVVASRHILMYMKFFTFDAVLKRNNK